MVNIAFICEGKTETELLSSASFLHYLNSVGLKFIGALNAKGSGNLLSSNIGAYIETLETLGAEKIIVVTDLDEDACITLTKQRINGRAQDIIVIAVRQIESWFLASSVTMQKLLSDGSFAFDFPEKEAKPFETIRNLMIEKTGRGIYKGVGGKVKLTHILLKLGLDITQAASHPNCPSAAYFLNKLNSLTV